MLSIQPISFDSGNEELRSIGVRTGIGHRQDTRAGVLEVKVLIGKLFTIDGTASGTVVIGEISSLKHELGNDAVEDGSLVSVLLGVVATAEGTKVFGSAWNDVLEQFHGDAAKFGITCGDFEKDFRVGHCEEDLVRG